MSWQYRVRITLVVCIIFSSISVVLPTVLRIFEWRYIYDNFDDVPYADVAIVLGASIVHGKPSPILEARTDAAIALFHKAKVTKILITGDGESTDYNEVNPVMTYMVHAGIPKNVILLDYHGVDTYESMLRARKQFGIVSAIIVTQDFHLPRAVYLARSLGIDAYGVPADNTDSRIFNYIREVPASIKAVFQIALFVATN